MCARLEEKDLFHTSFTGSWHPYFDDGGEDCVVPSALANQVDYSVGDLLDGITIQAMVFSRLDS